MSSPRASLLCLAPLLALSACHAAGAGDDPASDGAVAAAEVCGGGEGQARPAPVSLLVAPDDGDGRVVALIDAATASIDVTIYELTSPNIVGALVRAAGRGVHVRVIQDWQEVRDDVVAQLRQAGAEVQTSSHDFANTHQKTITVDRRGAFVFSGNFDLKSFVHSRNYGFDDDDADDVADVEELFEADWAARAPDLPCTRLVVAPVNARDRVLAFASAATTSLDVEALYITDRSVEAAIVAAHDRGVAVRVLLNDPSHHFVDNTPVAGRLAAHGIDVRRSGVLFVHAKLLVADDGRAFVGSENFSPTSLDKNREVGVFVSAADSDLTRLTSAFAADWTAGLAFEAAPPSPLR